MQPPLNAGTVAGSQGAENIPINTAVSRMKSAATAAGISISTGRCRRLILAKTKRRDAIAAGDLDHLLRILSYQDPTGDTAAHNLDSQRTAS